MPAAIKVENLSKVYRLGEYGTGTLSLDFQRWLAKVRGKEDPYLTIGGRNDRTANGSDIIYSLKNVDFEIEQGETVGVIGRNGAGKSTLLKILSRVTTPSSGRVHLRGRVASLLEVGTGFHPELTGKENIFLNGAILGMRKKEITKRLDEIIEFSGVQRYVNTPVKRYSSGMYVRLAFAVAAHLESEILIVDEVLAVGDIEFQKKCLGKMNEVSKADGRTVLFVSHNLSSINTLCRSGILLSDGEILKHGKVKDTINAYKALIDRKTDDIFVSNHTDGLRPFLKAHLSVHGAQPNIVLEVTVSMNVTPDIRTAMIVADIINSDGVCLYQSISPLTETISAREGETSISIQMQLDGTAPDYYSVNLYLCDTFFENIDFIKNVLSFEILESPVKEKLTFDYKGTENGYIYPPTEIILRS